MKRRRFCELCGRRHDDMIIKGQNEGDRIWWDLGTAFLIVMAATGILIAALLLWKG